MNERTIDRHSVNCAGCGNLVDERETVRNLCDGDIEFAAGELCQACALGAERGLKAPKMYNLLLELASCKTDERTAKLADGLPDILMAIEPPETGIQWAAVVEQARAEEPQESPGDVWKARYVFLGSVFALYPSGKYWVYPIAHSNVNILEMVRDTLFTERLQGEAEKHGGWIESGEGDPCDVFAVFPEKMEEPCEPTT
jgi:hypothetical protein